MASSTLGPIDYLRQIIKPHKLLMICVKQVVLTVEAGAFFGTCWVINYFKIYGSSDIGTFDTHRAGIELTVMLIICFADCRCAIKLNM